MKLSLPALESQEFADSFVQHEKPIPFKFKRDGPLQGHWARGTTRQLNGPCAQRYRQKFIPRSQNCFLRALTYYRFLTPQGMEMENNEEADDACLRSSGSGDGWDDRRSSIRADRRGHLPINCFCESSHRIECAGFRR